MSHLTNETNETFKILHNDLAERDRRIAERDERLSTYATRVGELQGQLQMARARLQDQEQLRLQIRRLEDVLGDVIDMAGLEDVLVECECEEGPNCTDKETCNCPDHQCWLCRALRAYDSGRERNTKVRERNTEVTW